MRTKVMIAKFLVLAAVLLIALVGVNCDLGINPLLFDGPPVTGTLRVDAVGSVFATVQVVDLGAVVKDVDKDIDSIKVYNITLQIDSTAGTNPSTTFSGSALVDGDSLLNVSGLPISAFATERSIFDATLTGGPIFVETGVAHLIAILKAYGETHTLPTITVVASGTASTSNLHFTIKVRLYTQLYLPPPNN
jgi:hypothetical protein